MADALRHRGPDGEGFFSNADQTVHLGMRRLAIIDLEKGQQPITNEDGSVVVVYNGEIYNFPALMADLQARGHVFATRCDTEVIAHAYEEWGLDCLTRFHGMFAFALYDLVRERLWIARDRTGMKPLYYHSAGGHLVFGSEIKALLESSRVPRRPNPAVIGSYLSLRYVPQPETFFDGIQCLPAAHTLLWQAGQPLACTRYWDVPLSAGPYKSDGEYLEAFDEIFRNAVKSHLISDVPVGAYLSGGVDSSAIVALMSGQVSHLKTFSLGFDSPIDETADARRLAGWLGTDHTEITCLPEHFALLPRMIYHLERPIGDPLILAYYLLAQETSRHVKVVLAGEGADELFAGYSFQKVILWTDRFRRSVPDAVLDRLVAPAVRRAPVDLLNRFFVFPAYLGQEGRAKVADFLAGFAGRSLFGNYTFLRTLFESARRDELLTPEFRVAQIDHVLAHVPLDESRARMPAPRLDQLLALQFDDWLQDFALLRQDKSAMAHSLEVRLPFLDDALVDLAFQLPPHLKIRGLADKVIERKWAERILPKANTRRSKNPFYLPLDTFHRHPAIAQLIDRTLNPDQVRLRGYFEPAVVARLVARMAGGEFLVQKQVMSLVILELWHQVFIDRTGID